VDRGLAAFVMIGMSANRCAQDHGLRRPASGGRLISTRSAEEEVEDEIRDLKDAKRAREATEMLIVTLAILIGLLALAVPVAAGLGILGLSLSGIYSSCRCRWRWARLPGAPRTFLLVAIPFFVLLASPAALGHGERMYTLSSFGCRGCPAVHAFEHRGLCDGLPHLGSSVATAATSVPSPWAKSKAWHSERLFLGQSRQGHARHPDSTSINMIVYGVLTERRFPSSTCRLHPGRRLASLFSLTVLLICIIRRAWEARRRRRVGLRHRGASRLAAAADHFPRRDRIDLRGLGDRH